MLKGQECKYVKKNHKNASIRNETITALSFSQLPLPPSLKSPVSGIFKVTASVRARTVEDALETGQGYLLSNKN